MILTISISPTEIKKLFATLFLVFIIYPNIARSQHKGFTESSVDSLLTAWNGTQNPGISIAIIKEGRLIYTRSLGMANIKNGIRNDSSTTFWIASVSKQFTAAAIYNLVSQKKVDLKRSVRSYLSDLPQQFEKVSIDQLIHHTSGIRDGFVLTALSKKPASLYTNENVLNYLKKSNGFNFEPGTEYEYNNSGYVLLATVIERVSGNTYAEYLKQFIFNPLGMMNTYVSPSFPKSAHQAEGYHQTAPNEFAEQHFPGNTYGSTGVIATLTDLAKWAKFIQDPKTAQVLAPIHASLLKPGKLKTGEEISYAGGLERILYRGKLVYEHFGADEGFKADILYFPKTKLSIIGLANNDSYYDLLRLLFNISEIVEGEQTTKQYVVEETKAGTVNFYYNAQLPEFRKSVHSGNQVIVGNTPGGYAAPHRITGDTLMSLDPIPGRYLLRDGYLEILDPYYHRKGRMNKIQPVTNNDDLARFTGEYYSPELETSYKIIQSEKGLQFEFVPGVAFDLFRLTDSDFIFEYVGPNYLQFTEKGLLLSREGVRRLQSEKK